MIDVAANRASRKWTMREQVGRLIWTIGRIAFRLSPRPFWAWRRMLLRAFGAKVEDSVHIYPTVNIPIPWNLTLLRECAVGDGATLYSLGPITIGARATVSQGAHLCAGTHNWRDPERALVKSPITIGEDAWICADAFIGPDVSVGIGAIVGARAVVMKDVPDNFIMAGNPARQIGVTNA